MVNTYSFWGKCWCWIVDTILYSNSWCDWRRRWRWNFILNAWKSLRCLVLNINSKTKINLPQWTCGLFRLAKLRTHTGISQIIQASSWPSTNVSTFRTILDMLEMLSNIVVLLSSKGPLLNNKIYGPDFSKTKLM